MSATNRGAVKSPNEYYHTPKETILQFWGAFEKVEPINIQQVHAILDPCAGGDENRDCAYPEALSALIHEDPQVAMHPFFTVDIRENSRAIYKEDYLKNNFGIYPLIISNPPFTMFEDFVRKAFDDCEDGGYIIFLLRLNALGGQKRRDDFYKHFKPKHVFIHTKRPFPDATEYAHFVWQKGCKNESILTHII